MTKGKEEKQSITRVASGGVTCKRGALFFYSSSMQVDSFVLRNLSERKAPKSLKLSTNFYS